MTTNPTSAERSVESVAAGLTSIEMRVLAYLEQRGPSHRANVVCDLASPDSRIGRLGGKHNGSNGATPLIMGRWCKRLLGWGFVRHVLDGAGYYDHHAITVQGRQALRAHLTASEKKG